jgi:hypothetical protein
LKRFGIVCLTAFLGCTIFFGVGFSQMEAMSMASPPVRLIQKIPRPGVQGRMDHFTVDAEALAPDSICLESDLVEEGGFAKKLQILC